MLEGKTVLITGAGRGIGAATALAVAQAGATALVTARRAGDADSVAASIRQAGGRAEPFACDVASHEEVARLMDVLEARFGAVDVLVNNAAIVDPIGAIVDLDPAAFARTISVNLVGAYHMVRAVLPGMRARGSGTIVNLSSGAASQALEGWAAYCTSKAGLAMLTRSIDLEHARDGIVVIGFAPGLVDTGMQGQVRQSGINPVSRLPRETLAPVEVPARLIAWLAGPGGSDYAGREVDARDEELIARASAAWKTEERQA